MSVSATMAPTMVFSATMAFPQYFPPRFKAALNPQTNNQTIGGGEHEGGERRMTYGNLQNNAMIEMPSFLTSSREAAFNVSWTSVVRTWMTFGDNKLLLSRT